MFEGMFIHFDKIHECNREMDCQTDGQTPHDSTDCTRAQYRAAKTECIQSESQNSCSSIKYTVADKKE